MPILEQSYKSKWLLIIIKKNITGEGKLRSRRVQLALSKFPRDKFMSHEKYPVLTLLDIPHNIGHNAFMESPSDVSSLCQQPWSNVTLCLDSISHKKSPSQHLYVRMIVQRTKFQVLPWHLENFPLASLFVVKFWWNVPKNQACREALERQ